MSSDEWSMYNNGTGSLGQMCRPMERNGLHHIVYTYILPLDSGTPIGQSMFPGDVYGLELHRSILTLISV